MGRDTYWRKLLRVFSRVQWLKSLKIRLGMSGDSNWSLCTVWKISSEALFSSETERQVHRAEEQRLHLCYVIISVGMTVSTNYLHLSAFTPNMFGSVQINSDTFLCLKFRQFRLVWKLSIKLWCGIDNQTESTWKYFCLVAVWKWKGPTIRRCESTHITSQKVMYL